MVWYVGIVIAWLVVGLGTAMAWGALARLWELEAAEADLVQEVSVSAAECGVSASVQRARSA